MGFRLNDLERRNGRVVYVISPNSLVEEDTPKHSPSKII